MRIAYMDEASVVAVILSAVGEFNEGVVADQRIPETAEAMLFGRGGKLDSLGLVNLILVVEEHIEKSYGVTLALADERAVSQERSPFRSVHRLAEYICVLLGESSHD
jgi:acyl carrier protein